MKPLAEFIWMNGETKRWADATVHVLTHGLHYGTSVFEGIRAYDTPNGACVFRLTDHIRRLFDSARIYGYQPPFSEAELVEACKAVMRANGLTSAYIRPIAFLGECGMGVIPSQELPPVDVAIAAFPWGAYLGEEGLERGVDVCVSSWARLAPNTVPAAAKAGGMPRSYWDWAEMMAPNKTGYFPYTPATNLLYGLDEALKMLGRQVELVQFPRENHDLSRTGEPIHRVERLHLIAGWFERFLR